jgi:predicted acetyltransferase
MRSLDNRKASLMKSKQTRGFEVVDAGPDKDPILRELLEFYLHDMAEWFKIDQVSSGRYAHPTEPYWQDGHNVYLLYQDSIPVGFGLVRVFQANRPALPFWRKTIARFTNGEYEEEVREKNGNLWSFFKFESPGV